MNINIEKLIAEASLAREGAYAPYSNFKVGSALITEDGKIYTGANVENASFGLTICSERNAVVKAVNDGARVIKAIAITADSDIMPTPCGACRQVLSEFSPNLEMLVIVSNTKGKHFTRKLSELLPDAFMFK